jgi:hypothetical protein
MIFTFLRRWLQNELAPAIAAAPSARQASLGVRDWTTRKGLARLIARCDRQEVQQAWLRVVIGGAVLIWLWYVAHQREANAPQQHAEVLVVAVTFFVFSCLLVFRILQAGAPSVRRRFLGMIIDNAVTTYCLLRMGEQGAVIIGVYLFITFGNGFRYGRLYLYACQVMALAGFPHRINRLAFLCWKLGAKNKGGEKAR